MSSKNLVEKDRPFMTTLSGTNSLKISTNSPYI